MRYDLPNHVACDSDRVLGSSTTILFPGYPYVDDGEIEDVKPMGSDTTRDLWYKRPHKHEYQASGPEERRCIASEN